MVRAALGWLAAVDVTALTADEQADCLRELARAESAHVAATSCILAGFDAVCGFEDDGHGSARTWLKWQTRVTGGAAAGAVGWMRRLTAHPTIREALATGRVSPSWARAICDWSDLLPADARGDADVILLAAAAGGAELADLAGLAEEMRRRTARPDRDGANDGFDDRSVRLDIHYRGSGKLDGELTPRCAAALAAVLDALGKKVGPEDTRTKSQRDHDALEEACRRLVASGCLPDRAGQPTQIELHMTLSQLAGLGGLGPYGPGLDNPSTGNPGPGNPVTDSPGLGSPVTDTSGLGRTGLEGSGGSGAGFGPALGAGGACGAGFGLGGGCGGQGQAVAAPWPTAGPGDDCDARIVPVLSGHVDPEILDRLAAMLLRWRDCPDHMGGNDHEGRTDRIGSTAQTGGASRTGGAEQSSAEQSSDVRRRGRAGELGLAYARELVLREAVALLSGPAGLAAWLRTSHLTGPAASVSLPLDTGSATEIISPQLRRAVIVRDRHCAFPGGCDQPPAACQVHHIIPRSQGGPTTLTNLGLLCTFHHLIVVHRWGWTLILHADGTYTAISPDRSRTLRTHTPPAAA